MTQLKARYGGGQAALDPHRWKVLEYYPTAGEN
jgi:hypothetical protein